MSPAVAGVVTTVFSLLQAEGLLGLPCGVAARLGFLPRASEPKTPRLKHCLSAHRIPSASFLAQAGRSSPRGVEG